MYKVDVADIKTPAKNKLIMLHYLDEVDTLDDVVIVDVVDTELEVDKLKIKENYNFKTNCIGHRLRRIHQILKCYNVTRSGFSLRIQRSLRY